MTETREKILRVEDVVIRFNLRGKELTAVRSASLDLYKGETLAIVGESGSGKSVFTKSFLGMLDKNGRVASGNILFEGENLAEFSREEQWLKIRGKKIAMIFQDPMTALNPLKTIGEQIREVITLHRGMNRQEARAEALSMLEKVGIGDAAQRYGQYPHEFSGGMRQRGVIAIAAACKPDILICDEPTTALDVTIQAQILENLKELQREMGMSIIFITHDLGVVANVADRVAVMYAGEIVEYGRTPEVFYDPRHPYSWALLASLPQLGEKGEDLYTIHGTPPNLFKEIKGDAFAPRNPRALKIDFEEAPPWFAVSDTHFAKTWLLHESAPEVEAPKIIQRLKEKSLKGLDYGS
ncbi:ABC transporter ATP-binding protein [Spirochaeta isovalerica]|uniref:Oligopeptide transport system ATP-binding protein n=1 Tax=Spirochaeta isovalerica TaxID=150 RepID=A0A841RBA0_9SPIO|nr:ABC transporter ATP-binding protein [Spirochaeta isovalerica]MBB6479958.1 oligopeptide transport system ATP-binding protein [Spirochaeta isovalerica]